MRIKLVSLLSSYFRGLIVSEVVSIGRTLFTATEPYPPTPNRTLSTLITEFHLQINAFPFSLLFINLIFSYQIISLILTDGVGNCCLLVEGLGRLVQSQITESVMMYGGPWNSFPVFSKILGCYMLCTSQVDNLLHILSHGKTRYLRLIFI